MERISRSFPTEYGLTSARWRERQLRSRDTSTVLPLLVSERIRRATQLCETIAADVENHSQSAESPGAQELAKAMDHLQTLLVKRS